MASKGKKRDDRAVSRPLPAERVFSLVATLMSSSRPMTREEILDRLRELYVPLGFPEPDIETLRKMFERDKRLVKDMGLPLVTVEAGQPGGEELEDGARGYRIEEHDLHLAPVELGEGQRLLLAAVAETVLSAPGFPLRDDLALAVHKVLMAAGGEREDAGLPCRFLLEGDEPERERIETALAAIRDRRSLRMMYTDAGGELTERIVDPYGLAPVDGAWLLTGHCRLRRARRTFALRRVREMRPAGPEGAGPDFEVPADFDARQITAVRPWRYEVHEPVEVVIEADTDFEWQATPLLGCEPQGGRYTIEATNEAALVEAVLVHGPRIRIVSPERLRRRVIEEAVAIGKAAKGRAGKARRERPAPAQPRRDDATSRLRRFLFLVSYLSRNPRAELGRLSSILGVDEAALLTDLERLSLCGVYPSTDFRLFDVSVDERSGTVALRRNPVPGLERPVRLTRRECVALLVALKLVRDSVAPPFDWTADRVMEEVARAAGDELAAAVGEMERCVSLASRHEVGWDTFYAVSMAVCGRERLEIEYYTQGRDSIGQRVVRPYALVCALGRWYLVGHCEWRAEVRTFRLDRIRSARPAGGTFEPPTGFDPGRHVSAAIYPDPHPAEGERVVVAFDPEIVEQSGGRNGMEFLPAGKGCEVTFSVHPDRHEGFLSWLLARTTRFRVVHPPALAERAASRRDRIVAAHS